MTRLTLAVLLVSLPSLAARVGVYPVSFDDGQVRRAAELTSALRAEAGDAALLPKSGCLPDEAACLAEAARAAQVDAVLSAEVRGDRATVRLVSAQTGKLLGRAAGADVAEGARRLLSARGALAAGGAASARREVPAQALELTVSEARARAELGLVGGGLGLLAAAAGAGLYAHYAQGGARPAGTAAAMLAATGAGAIVAGSLVLAITPESASFTKRF